MSASSNMGMAHTVGPCNAEWQTLKIMACIVPGCKQSAIKHIISFNRVVNFAQLPLWLHCER